jgi:branched-chain amino acid aminotransferase
MEICHSNGINLKEKMIRYSELSGFEVMFLTGTTRRIVPVKRIDNIVFSVESEILKTIINGFERLVTEYIESKKEINQY